MNEGLPRTTSTPGRDPGVNRRALIWKGRARESSTLLLSATGTILNSFLKGLFGVIGGAVGAYLAHLWIHQ